MQRGLVARNFIPPRCGKYHMSSAVCAAMICMPVRAPPRLLCGGLCTRRQHCAADLRNCVRREECAEGCCNQELREAAPPLCLRSVVSMEHITLFPTEHNRYLRIGSIKTPASVRSTNLGCNVCRRDLSSLNAVFFSSCPCSCTSRGGGDGGPVRSTAAAVSLSNCSAFTPTS